MGWRGGRVGWVVLSSVGVAASLVNGLSNPGPSKDIFAFSNSQISACTEDSL